MYKQGNRKETKLQTAEIQSETETEHRLSKDVFLAGTSHRHELGIAIDLFEGEQRGVVIGCRRWQYVGTAQLKAGWAHSFPGKETLCALILIMETQISCSR